jgi:small subunit ribosomal protein S2
MSDEEELLIDRDEYLAAGVHIGTKSTHVDMDNYIFHVKKNQLAVLDLDKTDDQIRKAADFLADYSPEEILVVGRKEEARDAINLFVEATGAEKNIGRFMPGTLTNPNSELFVEPEVLVVTDPEQDRQAIKEASQANIPVIAIADSGDKLDDIDIPIPANNKAEGSISTVYYLLAREIAEAKGVEFEYELEDFQPEMEEEEDEEE